MEKQSEEQKYIKFKTYDHGKFRISSRNIFLTYPKCSAGKTVLQAFLLDKLELDYCLVVQEAHEDGSPHLHALIRAKKKFDSNNHKCFDFNNFHGNYQGARNTDFVRNYLLKSDSEPLEYGTYESNSQDKVQKRAIKNKLLLDLPLHELVDKGEIALQQYKIIADAKRLYSLDKLNSSLPMMMERNCYWITGPPGSGKSYAARTRWGSSVYEKPQNKWWDGYNCQDVVLLDDLDKQGECLSHLLKIWSDKYKFNAEIKGGTIVPPYTVFIVTSNYYPEEIWASDKYKNQDPLCAAIRRRFTFYRMKSGYDMEVDPYIPSLEAVQRGQEYMEWIRDKIIARMDGKEEEEVEYDSYCPPA